MIKVMKRGGGFRSLLLSPTFAPWNHAWYDVAIAYHRDQPLVDGGATEQQGVYLYGDFALAALDGLGNVQAQLDSGGLTIAAGLADANKILWRDDGTDVLELYCYTSASSTTMNLWSYPPSGGSGSTLSMAATDGALATSIDLYQGANDSIDLIVNSITVGKFINGDLRLNGGLFVGNVSTNPDPDDVWCLGEISTDGGTTRWDLGGYAGGAPSATGYVSVTINGTTYRLLAAT